MRRRRQRGIALVTAILVVALATIAATAILTSANIAIHRSANLQNTEKAWWYADGVESFVKSVLERDDKREVDSLDEPWAKPIDYLPVEEGFLRGSLVDLQGRFNLNNLGLANPQESARYVAQFQKLAESAEACDSFTARGIASAVRDWIDADQEPTGTDGAEDTEYLGVNPAQRVPNRPMESVTELLAVRGMTRDIYLKLRDHVTVLPISRGATAINVNTATEPVLRSLLVQPNANFERFVRERTEKPASNSNELNQSGFAASETLNPPPKIAVNTDYFLLRAEAVIGSGRLALYSRYYRPDPGAPVVIGHSVDTE